MHALVPLCYTSLKGPGETDILKNNILFHCINNIIVIKLDEQMASVLEALTRFIHSRGTWVAQSVRQLSLDFGSGHDLPCS